MVIRDLATKARRILGDINSHRWTDERILDIVNAGIKDINKFAGVYRNECFITIQNFRTRYHLPSDVLLITSVSYNGDKLEILNQFENTTKLHVTKDQLNVGVLELKNFPNEFVKPNNRFTEGPTEAYLPSITGRDLWKDEVFNFDGVFLEVQKIGLAVSSSVSIASAFGVVTDPIDNFSGVTIGMKLSNDVLLGLPKTKFGLLSYVTTSDGEIDMKIGDIQPFGVLTALDPLSYYSKLDNGGSIGNSENIPVRIAGRYGVVVSALKNDEYIHVRYKALPKPLNTLDETFPLSTAWEEPIVNWIVGTALQDDNDASNNNRAQGFLNKYVRELTEGQSMSSRDYSSASRKYSTTYNGGIKR